jgi:hypothetical protein
MTSSVSQSHDDGLATHLRVGGETTWVNALKFFEHLCQALFYLLWLLLLVALVDALVSGHPQSASATPYLYDWKAANNAGVSLLPIYPAPQSGTGVGGPTNELRSAIETPENTVRTRTTCRIRG